jgi:sugar phosphate isomerase/epimerase
MIGLQLYTIRDQLQDPGTLGEVLSRVREIGYGAVEVAGLSPSARAVFGRELARAGLVACASHASLERLRADPDEVAAECREWGCDFVVVPALPEAERTPDCGVKVSSSCITTTPSSSNALATEQAWR